MTGRHIKPITNGRLFRFGKGSQRSYGVLLIRIPTPDNRHIELMVEVVHADIPFLLGLDIITR